MTLPADSNPMNEATIRDTAAHWVIRLDRKLSSTEAGEFSAWRAADPRHEIAFKQAEDTWQVTRKIGRLTRNVLPASAPIQPYWLRFVGVGLAAAAAVVLGLVLFDHVPNPASETARAIGTASLPREQRLADGSVVELKTGAAIAQNFSLVDRRIRLLRGDAFFKVAKDSTRPFLVEVGGVTVRAVGTAFAIRYEPDQVDVVVTEGVVQMLPSTTDPIPNLSRVESNPTTLIHAGYRGTIAIAPAHQIEHVAISKVSDAEVALTEAWSKPLLELTDVPLGELLAAFARQSGRQIEIEDPSLGAIQIGGRFPIGDVDGFLRAVQEVCNLRSEPSADGGIILRKAR